MLNQGITLKLQLRPSFYLSLFLSFSLCVLLVLMLMAPWRLWFKIMVLLLGLIWSIFYVRSIQSMISQYQITLLFKEYRLPSAWQILFEPKQTLAQKSSVKKDSIVDVLILQNSRALGPFVFLNFKKLSSRKRYYFILLEDSMSAQQWRSLRRWILLNPRALMSQQELQ